ncbi:MAG: ABC transporter permease subunit [Butyrivibrio sp.]|nr:ABC transporter permease subunit [Muribaculum sp.]MCM1551505.1 ABC transporter permease subunit [Butyrivibrio sp.]
MKFHLNPIIKKDLQVTSRSMRLSWGLFGYEAVLAMAFLGVMAIIQSEGNSIYGGGNFYGYLIYLFPVLAVAQVCIVALITPIITASSISGEKERQTFDIMLTTCMSPFSIVLGKVASAVLHILFYVAGSLPIMALSFVVGGMSWLNLFYFILAIILFATFSGSIGIFCSSVCRKSIASVILSFVFYFVIYGLTAQMTLVCMLIINSSGSENFGESLLFLLFNPIVFFEEFFMQLMTGTSLFAEAEFTASEVGFLTYTLAQGKVWMFVSAACILLMAVLFMLAAAWNVNPMHSASGRRRVKKKVK